MADRPDPETMRLQKRRAAEMRANPAMVAEIMTKLDDLNTKVDQLIEQQQAMKTS